MVEGRKEVNEGSGIEGTSGGGMVVQDGGGGSGEGEGKEMVVVVLMTKEVALEDVVGGRGSASGVSGEG